jgi:tetratricopeptide (TPR) repeat protein
MVDNRTLRLRLILATAASVVALGTLGWLLLGPLWAIAGVAVGCVLPSIAVAVSGTYFSPSSIALISKGQAEDALRKLQREEASSRRMAKIWPGQFREALAWHLIATSDALHALHRFAHALRSADEGVMIYQALAASNPAKYLPYLSGAIDTQSRALAGLGRQHDALQAIETAITMYRQLAASEPRENLPALAEALTCKAEWLADIDMTTQALAAAQEAAAIYWHLVPVSELPLHAARAALLEGRLLCQQGRCEEAARPLARGWKLATIQHQDGSLSAAAPAVRAAHRASPEHFDTIWRDETSTRPPDWLTTT